VATKSKVEAPKAQGSVKVSRNMVALIEELAELRSMESAAKKRIAEIRDLVLDLGEGAFVLTHHSVEVARITERETTTANVALLREQFPEVWESVKQTSTQRIVSAVTRRN
jgi:hypothetical protein